MCVRVCVRVRVRVRVRVDHESHIVHSSPPLGRVRQSVSLSVFPLGAGPPLVPNKKAPVAASQSVSQPALASHTRQC